MCASKKFNNMLATIRNIMFCDNVYVNYTPNAQDHKDVNMLVNFWWKNNVILPADIVFFLKKVFDIDLNDDHEFKLNLKQKKSKAPPCKKENRTKDEKMELVVKRMNKRRIQSRLRAFDKDTKYMYLSPNQALCSI